MKEALEKETQAKIEAIAEHKKQSVILGSVIKVPGHTMFEYNSADGTLEPAQFTEVMVETQFKKQHQQITRHKLVIKEGCVYVQALNRKNAVKKLIKGAKMKAAAIN